MTHFFLIEKKNSLKKNSLKNCDTLQLKKKIHLRDVLLNAKHMYTFLLAQQMLNK